MSDLEACVLRVCDKDGKTRGTGFLVSESLAVTCAHVIDLCGAKPGDRVRIVFHATGQECEAEVLCGYWRPANADDVAFLRLLPEGGPLPVGVTPVTLGMTRACNGHKMRVLGFPQLAGGYNVAWAEGELRGVVPHPNKQPMLQMDARPIQRGMSGALVFDLTTQRVVGMVSEYLPDAPLEWATTTETLQAICPDLQLHAPQAVEDYLAALREYCTNLPYLTLHDIRPPKTLDEVYVPFKARAQPRKGEKQETDEERAIREVLRSEPLSISEVMQKREQPHLLILGEPGAGKSTLLRQLAERAWDAPEKIGLGAPHLPILVPLRRLATADGSLEERLNRALTAELMLTQELPKGFFADWPAQTGANWLILLDALDEVPADERARLMQWLKGMLATVGQNRIIITSRSSGYSSGELDERLFDHYDLLPFTPEQTCEFARKWFDTQADHFIQEFQRMRTGNLRGTPLLLTIAAKVYLETDRLPEQRSSLYWQFVNIWLSEAEQHGLKAELGDKLAGPTGLQITRLAYLALQMTEYPESAAPQALSSFIAEFLQSEELFVPIHAEHYSNQFLQVMGRRSGVFIYRGDACEFIHPTFREYLAAFSAAHKCSGDVERAWRFIETKWSQQQWQGTIEFFLAILNEQEVDTDELVRRILAAREQIDEFLYRPQRLVGECLAEITTRDESLRRQVIDELLGLVRTSTYCSEVSLILARLPRSEMVAMGLLALVEDPNAEVWRRRYAVIALGQHGYSTPDILQALRPLVENPQTELLVRIESMAALGRLGFTDYLLDLVRSTQADTQTKLQVVSTLHDLWCVKELFILTKDSSVAGEPRFAAVVYAVDLGQGENLVPIMLDSTLPVLVRLDVATVLSQLGPAQDEATETLLLFVNDSRLDYTVRSSAAKSLEKSQRPDAASRAWTTLAGDPRLSTSNKQLAAEALNRLSLAKSMRT